MESVAIQQPEEEFESNISETIIPNKEIIIKKIDSFDIENFRTIKNRKIKLGDNITLITGKNGTMKSSILGLIAHPFSSPNKAKDFFDVPLKTSMSDVFKLSLEKDKDRYNYHINIVDINNNYITREIKLYRRLSEDRFRVTAGKNHTKGEGNFLLNTSYINFKRLYPIIDTDAKEYLDKTNISSYVTSDDKRNEFIREGYYKIIQKEEYSNPIPISDINKSKNKIKKYTYAPSNADYDYNAISSGEDNIGHILNKMYAFIENKTESEGLQGIFCIDEIEAGLHPVAQENLFNFLLHWSQKHKIQIVATTHSLYLIQHAIIMQEKLKEKSSISLNMISTAFTIKNNFEIIYNPDYKLAYKELTFKEIKDINPIYKINILCEDKIAKYYIFKILKSKDILKQLEFMYDLTDKNEGSSFKSLTALMRNGKKLLEDSIVIFDPDYKNSDLKNYGVSFLYLPEKYKMLAIEKMIVKFIYDLEGNDKFFIENKKEKASFINDFASYNIKDLDDVNKIYNDKTEKYKNWASSDIKKFYKYINKYIEYNADIILPFKNDLINQINQKLQLKSLPTFEI